MFKRSVILALFFVVTAQNIDAMNELGNKVIKCPTPTKSVMAWLLSPFYGTTQEIKRVDYAEGEAPGQKSVKNPNLLVPIPGRVDMDEKQSLRILPEEVVAKRPPTPYYEYPGGPPVPPSPEPKSYDRCSLKVSTEYFPCGGY